MNEARELTLAFGRELQDLQASGRKLSLEFTPTEAWTLLTALQRALLFLPIDAQAEFVEQLARHIQRRICLTPAMQRLAENGWDNVEALATPAPPPKPAAKKAPPRRR